MYSYRSYGLDISSEFYLPEFAKAKYGADVIIRRGKIDALPPEGDKSKNWVWTDDEGAHIFLAGVGSIIVRRGDEIIVDLAPGVDEKKIRPYLPGSLAYLLHQKGFLALHGSAVLVDNFAVAFLGRSGKGKSTMAAALIDKFPLITDDVIALRINRDIPFVYPAFPQINLWPDVAASLGYDTNILERLVPDEEKLAVRLDHDFSQDAIPLKKIFILDEGQTIGIQTLGRQDAMMALVNNTFTVRSIKAGVNVASHFLLCAELAKHVPIRRLIRPLDLKVLPDAIRMIEDDLGHDRIKS